MEDTNREFITDILTIVSIAVSLWLTAERDENASEGKDARLPDMRMLDPTGEQPK